jgi:hypothetical protein
MKKTEFKRNDLPLFEEFSIEELDRRTGYSESHLLSIKHGWREANNLFRRKMSTILGRSEDELFGEVTYEN